jgi:predicted NBD/HSP70 family sugar kinase
MSRAELARELGLSAAAVTQIARRLQETGMVSDVAQAPSTGGRPGQLIGLVGSAGRALGVKVAVDHLAVVNVSLDGRLLSSTTQPFDAAGPDVLHRLSSALEPRLTDGAEDMPPLIGIGVAVPGTVTEPDTGSVDADVLGWNELPVGRFLRGAFGLPAVVENDVNALAVAEVLYGRGRESDSFLVLTIGRGIGLGIVTDGSVYRGSRGGAGEFGHFPVIADGPECGCGRRGCLEALIGEPALVRTARERGVLGPRQGLSTLAKAADAADPAAGAVFAEAGTRLGFTFAGLANVLNPELIIIAGEGSRYWSHWQQAFKATFAEHAMSHEQVRIVVDNWDDTNWAQGAAALVLAAPFDLDGITGQQTDLVMARLQAGAREAVS